MKTLLSLFISFIAGISTIIGSFVVFLNIKKENINKFISFSLSFSVSIMVGISIFDLIPNSFFSIIKTYNLLGIPLMIVIFLIGYFIIKVLSKKMDILKGEGKLYKLGILSMITLIIHNLPEGIATFISSYQDINMGLKLGFAIMLHNIPEGITIAVPLYYSTKSKRKAILYTVLSGLSEPIGALLAFIILKKYITMTLIDIILLLVASLMITLSIEEILPKANDYNEKKYVIYGLILGLIIIITSLII